MSSFWKRSVTIGCCRPSAAGPAETLGDSGGLRPRCEPRVSEQDAWDFALRHASDAHKVIGEERRDVDSGSS